MGGVGLGTFSLEGPSLSDSLSLARAASVLRFLLPAVVATGT